MVFLFQRYLPHYRVPVFHRLGRALHGRLVVCHGDPPRRSGFLKASGQGLSFDNVVLRNRWLAGESAVWQSFLRPFNECGPPSAVIAEASLRILSLPPLLASCRIRSIPIVLWAHAASRRRDLATSSDPRDLVHVALLRQADAVLCYTEGQKDKLLQFVESNKVFVAVNTVDTPPLFALRRDLEGLGRMAVRRELGLEQRPWIAFLGRMLPEKRPAELLKVLVALHQRGVEAGGLVLGDGPERDRMASLAQKRGLNSLVRFVGSVTRPGQLGRWLFAADALVMPGSVGLAVNHALAFGLPVVTSAPGPNGPYHGPEIEHLVPGETGFLVHGDFAAGAAGALRQVLKHRESYHRAAVSLAEERLSVERMVEGIQTALASVMDDG